ncbi:hypothetical protein D3C85_1269410 [compost metagenome]
MTTDFEQMPDDRLRLLIDAHALPVDVLRNIVECARDGQRWPSTKHRTHQAVFGSAGGVVKHGPLLVTLVAGDVLDAGVVLVGLRQINIASGLYGFGALAHVSHQPPTGLCRVVLRAGVSNVCH